MTTMIFVYNFEDSAWSLLERWPVLCIYVHLYFYISHLYLGPPWEGGLPCLPRWSSAPWNLQFVIKAMTIFQQQSMLSPLYLMCLYQQCNRTWRNSFLSNNRLHDFTFHIAKWPSCIGENEKAKQSNAKIYFLPAVFFDTSNFLSVEVRSVICTHYNLGRKWWGNKLFQMFVSPIWFWLSDVFISRCKFTSINSWKHSFSFERLAVPQCNFFPRIFSWLPKITHAARLLAKPDTKSVEMSNPVGDNTGVFYTGRYGKKAENRGLQYPTNINTVYPKLFPKSLGVVFPKFESLKATSNCLLLPQ